MTATRPVPAPDVDTVTSRILPAGTTPASPGLTPPGQTHEQTDGPAEQTDEQAHLNLSAVITAACDARHFTVATMTAWELQPDAILHAKIVVSELVTNAYHAAHSVRAAGCISLTLRRLPDQVVIEVSDNGPGLPVKSCTTDDAESGRGLHMIEAMSQEWGYQPKRCGGGKVVYAIMRVGTTQVLPTSLFDPWCPAIPDVLLHYRHHRPSPIPRRDSRIDVGSRGKPARRSCGPG